MKLLSIDNSSGSRFYRLIPQMKWMEKQGHLVKMISHDDPHMERYVEWADLVIFEMAFSLQTIKDIKKYGKPMIFEVDDLLHSVPKSHYSYKSTRGWNRVKWWIKIIRTFSKMDGLITTTKPINRLYGWLPKKSLVFHNYIDIPHWLKEPKKNTGDKIRLLWAGSTSHAGDLVPFKPVIKEILRKFPQVQFIYVGMGGTGSNDLYTQFIYGDDFFEELPKERRETILPVPPNIWPYILASTQADIAIAPLEKNYFNKHKSQCKFLEYSINEIPGVYSRWHYGSIVKEGITGYTADSHKEWVDKLSVLINSGTIRKTIGKNAKQDVLDNYTTKNHLQKWQCFVEGIYKGRGNKSEPPNSQIAS